MLSDFLVFILHYGYSEFTSDAQTLDSKDHTQELERSLITICEVFKSLLNLGLVLRYHMNAEFGRFIRQDGPFYSTLLTC